MKPRVALLADFLEEQWTSMDHYAEMLLRELRRGGRFEPSLVRPRFRTRLGHLAWLLGPRHGRTLDRYLNRHGDYPRFVKREHEHEVFHVLDQTYAGVVRALPAERTVVTCHDLDFAEPPPGTRLAWLVRATGAMTLPGLQRAARVLCDSEAIRLEILRRGLVAPDRLAVVPLGVEDEFTHEGTRELPERAEALLAGRGPGPFILNVGGMVSRKRLDLALRAFASIRGALPGAVLVRAGGALSPAMQSLAERLDVASAVASMPFLTRPELAALYRRADAFLLCSETEGFGLPVLEAMASGTPVITRELPAVREVAGEGVRYVDGEDPEAFAAAVLEVLRDEALQRSMRRLGIERAAGFRWADTAERTERVYREVLDAIASPA